MLRTSVAPIYVHTWAKGTVHEFAKFSEVVFSEYLMKSGLTKRFTFVVHITDVNHTRLVYNVMVDAWVARRSRSRLWEETSLFFYIYKNPYQIPDKSTTSQNESLRILNKPWRILHKRDVNHLTTKIYCAILYTHSAWGRHATCRRCLNGLK